MVSDCCEIARCGRSNNSPTRQWCMPRVAAKVPSRLDGTFDNDRGSHYRRMGDASRREVAMSREKETPRRPRLPIVASECPAVYQCLLSAWVADENALGSEVFTAMQRRIRSLLGRSELSSSETSHGLSPAMITLLEAYVNYVPDVTPEMLADVETELGEAGMRAYVDALYIVDQSTRLDLTHERLFADVMPSDEVLEEKWTITEMSPSRASVVYHDTIAAMQDVFPLLDREIVRLRAGEYHQCGYCKSIRLESNGSALVPPRIESQIADYASSALSPGQKAALEYADAHMQDPSSVDDGLRDRLRAEYSHRQIVQLTLDVNCWNYQKLLVALGTDQPANDEHLTLVTIDEKGVIHHGELIH